MEIVKGLAEQQLSRRCGVLGIGLNMCGLLEDRDALSLGWYDVAAASVSQGEKRNHCSLLDFSVVLQLYLPMHLNLEEG